MDIKGHFKFGLKVALSLFLIFLVFDLVASFVGINLKSFVLNPLSSVSGVTGINIGGGATTTKSG